MPEEKLPWLPRLADLPLGADGSLVIPPGTYLVSEHDDDESPIVMIDPIQKQTGE